jgi:hypothetical protein
MCSRSHRGTGESQSQTEVTRNRQGSCEQDCLQFKHADTGSGAMASPGREYQFGGNVPEWNWLSLARGRAF